jgi:hypothetical protein
MKLLNLISDLFKFQTAFTFLNIIKESIIAEFK